MRARAGGREVGVAAACAVAVWLLWRVFVATAAGQRVERLTLDGAARELLPGASRVLDVVSVGFVAAASLAAVAVAAVRRHWHLALQAVVLVAGANATTQLLKQTVLDRPRLGDAPPRINSLPSGHTTAAASVAFALLLVVPARARPAVAVAGAGWTALTGASTQVGEWHRPSDVVAGVLVALGWAALVGLLSRPASPGVVEPPAPIRAVERVLVVGGVATGLLAAAALAVTWANRAPPATASVEVVAHLGGLAAAVATSAFTFALALALRRGLDDAS